MSTPTTDKPAEKSADKGKTYKDTLNLPTTAFPMEAKLVTREPERLARWKQEDLYAKVQAAHANDPTWLLHDGPPFANGDIHMGHVTNKVLKDVFLRYKTMAGHRTPYIPGWDCHGLPIEHKIQQELGPKLREMSPVEIRKKCYDYAAKWGAAQSEQFQRLGILGDWENPYYTMRPQYEGDTIEVFANFVEAGLVYKQLKPVQWSIANQTALADAELEYQDVEDNTVYVEFPAANPGKLKGDFGLKVNAPVVLLAWTTTPWTLPANLAITVGPDVVYAFCSYVKEGMTKIALVAQALAEKVLKEKGKVAEYTVLSTATGSELVEKGLTYMHPFVAREGRLLQAEYVTTTDGTGLVHTAPGHGEEDYETCRAVGIDAYCPVLANGRYDATVPDWLQGKLVWEANDLVTAHLRQTGHLFAEEKYTHPYPHDWRSKTKTITRATEQWFIAMDKHYEAGPRANAHDAATEVAIAAGATSIRGRALTTVKKDVEFIPAWGQARIEGMLQSRPDWCISRQRAWGLPIPIFYNEQGDALLDPGAIRSVAKVFREKGSDAWFTDSAEELLKYHDCGPNFPKASLRKERDIFDVWFESGSSWNSVLRARGLPFPADLYLEGSDQHRGWFQLSLLNSLGGSGVAPFKKVLTHGFIVKPDGTKVSKSDKEYVTATTEINRHGADLLRLWCCSMDYQGDLPVSPKALQEFGDKYRKLRNTIKYLLSNLYDFDPKKDAVEVPANSLDGWALAETDKLVRETTEAYEAFSTHKAFRALHDFCAVQVSSVYANAMKDRLYCDAPNSPLRRRCQTVLHRMADVLIRFLAPMVVFTADEAWEFLPGAGGSNVHTAALPKPLKDVPSEAQQHEWKLLMDLRDSALLQLDGLKKSAALNKSVDAEIVYHVDDDALRRTLQAYGSDLEDLAGCGSYSFAEKGVEGPAVTVSVHDRRTDEAFKSCARSWKRRRDVGSDPAYQDLSARDAGAVKGRLHTAV